MPAECWNFGTVEYSLQFVCILVNIIIFQCLYQKYLLNQNIILSRYKSPYITDKEQKANKDIWKVVVRYKFTFVNLFWPFFWDGPLKQLVGLHLMR